MFTPKLRLALAVVSFLFGAYRIALQDYNGLILLAASALLAYGYFRHGTVWLAFRAVARGQMDSAVQLLNQVKRPEALTSQDRAYYELAWGLVCASRSENERAEVHLKQALDEQLRTDNDRALAEAVFAQLLVARGERAEARSVLDRAITRQSRPVIAQRIKTLREELAEAE